MKKISIVMQFVAAVAIMTALATSVSARSVGTVYGDALTIGTDRASPTATITSAGVLTVTALSNSGAVTGTTGALSSTLDVNGNSTFGADNYVTTNTAASGAWAFPATVSIGGVLTQTGALNAASTLDVNGNFTSGADNFVTTNTASTGAWAFPAAVSIAGAVTGPTSITATKLVANGAGSVGLYSRTKAQILLLVPAAAGQAYYCSDCTAVTVCVSTGTEVGAFTKVTDRTAACD